MHRCKDAFNYTHTFFIDSLNYNSILILFIKLYIFYLQSVFCYGLIDSQMILSPVPTGQWIEMPYFAGHIYAAYKAIETKQVNIYCLCA